MSAPLSVRVLGAAVAALVACTPGSCVPARASEQPTKVQRYSEATFAPATKVLTCSNSTRADCDPLSVALSKAE
jgi:hypothetical protein